MKSKTCRFCGDKLKGGEYAAFCPDNPNGEKNRLLLKAGDKRFRFVKRRKVVIGPCLMLG